jgi:thiol-disulfide isomerase/thioredoxin
MRRTPLLPVCVLLAITFPASPQSATKSALDLEGRPADPFRLAGSKLLVFLFIRTDCPISNRYAPTIQDLSSRYSEHAVFFLVYPIASETPAQIRKHLQEYGYQLPALRDPDLVLARKSHVSITPEAAVFSPEKKLLYHGRIDDWYVEFGRARREPTTHELAATLDNAIAHKPVATTDTPAVGCFIPGLT